MFHIEIINDENNESVCVVKNGNDEIVAGPFNTGGRLETIDGIVYFRPYHQDNGWSNHAYQLGAAAQPAPDLLPCQRIASKAPAGPKPGWMPKGG